jgi:2,3-bisphosphoglycerate-dependent phosphoglycerate mutase
MGRFWKGRGLAGVAVVIMVLPACGEAPQPGATAAQMEALARQAPAREASAASSIILVRHAEKAEEPEDDPGLTPEGEERAREVARLLSDVGVTHVHSSDFLRTRATGEPLAQAMGLEIQLYDHREPGPFIGELLATPGRHLVVGHSNTLPELAELMGGEGYGEIVEEWEYDRLYILTPTRDGMETVLLRFGAHASP